MFGNRVKSDWSSRANKNKQSDFDLSWIQDCGPHNIVMICGLNKQTSIYYVDNE